MLIQCCLADLVPVIMCWPRMHVSNQALEPETHSGGAGAEEHPQTWVSQTCVFNTVCKLLKSIQNFYQNALSDCMTNTLQRSMLPYLQQSLFARRLYIVQPGELRGLVMWKLVAYISPFYSSSVCLFIWGMQATGLPEDSMSRKTGFLAQTHAVSERGSSAAWDSAALTSKTDSPAVPALLEAPAWLAGVQEENTKSKDSWVTSRVLLITLTHTVARLNKQAFIVRWGAVWNPKLQVVLWIQRVFSTSTNAVWRLVLLQTGAVSQNASCLLLSLFFTRFSDPLCLCNWLWIYSKTHGWILGRHKNLKRSANSFYSNF